MRGPTALLALALLLAPTAAAGTPDDPEAPDPPMDTATPNSGFADFLGVWLEATNGTLLVGVKLVDYSQFTPGACWSLGFRAQAVDYTAQILADPQGAQAQRHSATITTPDGAEAAPVVATLGAPGFLRVTVPSEVLAVAPGEVVELTALRSCFVAAGETQAGAPDGVPGGDELPVSAPTPESIDTATAQRSFSVPFPKPEPKPVDPVAKSPAANKTTTNASKSANAQASATKTTASGAANETVTPTSDATATEQSAQPPERGFFGLPGPGVGLVLAAAIGLALARRRRRD